MGDEYVNRYIFLTLGESKIAIIKIHKDDFFWIDVKSNSIKDKIFHCKDVLFKEIIYYDEDSNQPKITGQNKMENSIPLLSLETNNYSLINYGNYNKSKENKEEIDLLIKYRNDNKELVEQEEDVQIKDYSEVLLFDDTVMTNFEMPRLKIDSTPVDVTLPDIGSIDFGGMSRK